jgi:hypothetical protein
MLEDLCAVQQTLEQCLQIRDEPHLRGWYQLLDETLPQYQPLFGEVERALSWVDGIAEILDVPLPTADNPGSGGDEVARRLAHYLGSLATLDDLSPWLTQFRKDLFARSELLVWLVSLLRYRGVAGQQQQAREPIWSNQASTETTVGG